MHKFKEVPLNFASLAKADSGKEGGEQMAAGSRKKKQPIRAGIDIGTKRVRVYIESEGIVFDEPCILAIDQKGQTLAIGDQAWQMRGLSDDQLQIIRPFENGKVRLNILNAFLEQLCLDCGIFRLFRRSVIAVSYPTMLSDEAAEAIRDWLMDLGADKVYFDREILFSALGSRINLNAPVASCIMNIGHENCEIAAFARSKMISRSAFSINGAAVSRQIDGWLRDTQQISVSEETVEAIKENLGGFQMVVMPKAMEIFGISLATGNFESLVVDENQIAVQLAPVLREWAGWITGFLSSLEPADQQDIAARGIVACGGCLKLNGLAGSLQKLCGIPIYCADEPSLTVVAGLQTLLQKLDPQA